MWTGRQVCFWCPRLLDTPDLTKWIGHTREQVQAMKDGLAELKRRGAVVIYD